MGRNMAFELEKSGRLDYTHTHTRPFLNKKTKFNTVDEMVKSCYVRKGIVDCAVLICSVEFPFRSLPKSEVYVL